MYRPRIISFLFQYIDSHFDLFMNSFFPQWGFRLLGYYLSLCLIVLASLRLIKQLLPNSPLSLRVLLALMPLVWLNTLWTLMVTLRSAKLLCVACIIYMFSILIEKKIVNSPSQIRSVLFHSSLFILFYLVDEQNISYAALFTLCSIFLSCLDRKIHLFAISGLCSLLIYGLLYYTLLKFLFSYFTPNISLTHLHNSSRLSSNLSWDLIKLTMERYLWVILNNFSVLLVFFIAALIRGIYQKKIIQLSTLVILIMGTLVNTLAIALMHTPIATYNDLKMSMYYLPLLTVFYCLILYFIKDFFLTRASLWVTIGVILVLITNVARFDKAFDMVKKGHLAFFVPTSILLSQAVINRSDQGKEIIEASKDLELQSFYSAFCEKSKQNPLI